MKPEDTAGSCLWGTPGSKTLPSLPGRPARDQVKSTQRQVRLVWFISAPARPLAGPRPGKGAPTGGITSASWGPGVARRGPGDGAGPRSSPPSSACAGLPGRGGVSMDRPAAHAGETTRERRWPRTQAQGSHVPFALLFHLAFALSSFPSSLAFLSLFLFSFPFILLSILKIFPSVISISFSPSSSISLLITYYLSACHPSANPLLIVYHLSTIHVSFYMSSINHL